jgi:hypothetical protein
MPSFRTIAVTVAIVLATNFIVKRTPLAAWF